MSQSHQKSENPLIGYMAERAKAGRKALLTASPDQRTNALNVAARLILERSEQILEVNRLEVTRATAKDLKPSFVDRMSLDAERIEAISQSLIDIAGQQDPIGEVISSTTRPNGLIIERIRTPIGVIGIIFESRPNVTADAAAICIKSGNAAILRSGSDCLETSRLLQSCIEDGLSEAGINKFAVQLVDTTDRNCVGELLSGLDGTIDVVIPRGGKSLVERVQRDARVPTLSHLEGNCHVFVDRDADISKACDIVLNSKLRRTGVCGAAETLLVDETIAKIFLPAVATELVNGGCTLRGDKLACSLSPNISQASEEDYYTEYLAPILAVAIVDGLEGAIEHLGKYSSGHTDAIVTENNETARKFLAQIDSAIVIHNASTQFADGGEFGLGAEIGISTGKLHARGPVGVKELTTYKNTVRGTGQTRP